MLIKYIMYYIIIILFIIFVIYLIKNNIETYYNFNPNYANNVYVIRPPYEMAKEYDPNKLGAVKILKDRFLNYPIEG